MIDNRLDILPERFVGNEVSDGACREESEAVTFREVLGTVVSGIELDEIPVIERICGTECETLLTLRKRVHRRTCRKVHVVSLIVHCHRTYTMLVREYPVVVHLALELIGTVTRCLGTITEELITHISLCDVIETGLIIHADDGIT